MDLYPFPDTAGMLQQPGSVMGSSGKTLMVIPCGFRGETEEITDYIYYASPEDVPYIRPSMILPEMYSREECCIFIDSVLSGGTLRERFRQAVQAYGQRLWLRVLPLRVLLPLPCPTGCGRDVSDAAFAEYLSQYVSVFSHDFFCYYCLTEEGLLLYDTEQTVLQKLELAGSLGIRQAFGAIPIDTTQKAL